VAVGSIPRGWAFLDAHENQFVSFSPLSPADYLWSEPAIRLVPPIFSSLALLSCASGSASKAELSDLRAELHALREENARLTRRIDQLEGGARPLGKSTADPREVPALTVIKLKPKSEPPASISVSIPVQEPAPEVLAEILDSPPGGTARSRESARASDSMLEAEFAEGLTALKTGNVSGGIARLQRFAAENPRHPKADNALYLSGVGLMGQGSFEAAAGAFERVIAAYPAGDAVKDAMVRLAECRTRLKSPAQARALYSEVLKKYPGSAAANEATQRLALLPP
jgi:tol-pal system protein YbgF